jgi:hypothetical protein
MAAANIRLTLCPRIAQSEHTDCHIASEAKMFKALILVPTVLATLSFTLALQSSTKFWSRRTQRAETARSQLITVITDLNLQAVLALCLIGFLLILYFILRFPDLGALIEKYNKF